MTVHQLRLLVFVAGVVLLNSVYAMSSYDAFSTEGLAMSPPMASAARVGICPIGKLPEQLTVHEAITRILCQDPAIRQAWSTARMRAAQLGLRKSEYLPRLDARLSRSANRSYDGYAEAIHSNNSTGNFSLSWVLFDFGRRDAALASTHQLLSAANADQNAAIQNAFLGAAQLYFAAQASNQRLAAAQQVMDLAKDTYIAAAEKYKAGAAALSDRLRAKTAYTQASLHVSQERGALSSSLGTMALRMGLPAHTLVRLDEHVEALPSLDFIIEVDELIRLAGQQHPRLVAVEARTKAAQAAVQEASAMARPKIALTSSFGVTDYSVHGRGSRRKDMNIGLQLSIPLFSGFEQTYQIRAAKAQAATYAEEAEVARLRLSVDVWTQHNGLRTEAENLVHTSDLVNQSKQAMDIVQGRYQSGVGSMTEVLNAMETYAKAQEQHISAMANWRALRLSLAAQLGRLGFWDLD